MVGLIRERLAAAVPSNVTASARKMEVSRLRITDAGRRALAKMRAS
jgi:hypothetical protein